MAFTAEQQVTLGDMTGYDPVALSNWLDGITISDELEAKIVEDIDYWDSNIAYLSPVNIEAKEANFGASIQGDALKTEIMNRTRRRLQMPTSYASAGIGTLQISR